MIICEICKKVLNDGSLGRHLATKKCMELEEYYNQYLKKDPSEGKCKTCGNKTLFKNMRLGYNIHCSNRCTNMNPEIRNKIKETTLIRYGVEHPSQSSVIQQKKIDTSMKRDGVEHPSQTKWFQDKIKNTCLEKYGVSSVSQIEGVKQKKIDTCLENYGVSSPMKSDEIQSKRKLTCLEKFGVEHSLQSTTVRLKMKETCLEKYGTEFTSQSEEVKKKIKNINFHKYGVSSWSQTDEGRKFHREKSIRFIETQKLNGERLCPMVGPKGRECLNILQKYTKHFIERETRLHGFFADGFIRELKLVIEFDENYHKSQRSRKKDFYKDQYFKKQNIKVFRISEDDWFNNQSTVIQNFIQFVTHSTSQIRLPISSATT